MLLLVSLRLLESLFFVGVPGIQAADVVPDVAGIPAVTGIPVFCWRPLASLLLLASMVLQYKQLQLPRVNDTDIVDSRYC
jgi:hypothetical protein